MVICEDHSDIAVNCAVFTLSFAYTDTRSDEENEHGSSMTTQTQQSAHSNIMKALSSATYRGPSSFDAIASSDDKDDDRNEEILEEMHLDQHIDDGFFNWGIANDELLDEVRGLSAEELLGEDFEREAAENGVFLYYFLTINQLIFK